MEPHRSYAPAPWPRGAIWLLAIALGLGPAACKKKKAARPNPWARALPKTRADYPLPAQAEATVRLTRELLELNGRRLHPLKDGRLARAALRDGVDGLFVPALHAALDRLRKAAPDGKRLGRLAIHSQPAVPFRTLRAVLYTAMRAGYLRPWLVAEGAKQRLVALPLELPSSTHATGHGLRSDPPRIPALAVGVTRAGLHVTRWSRPACPAGVTAAADGACFALGSAGLTAGAQKRLGGHLLELAKQRAARARPGAKRRAAVMVWAGLDTAVGSFVRLLDAAREAPGQAGTCALTYQPETGRWQTSGAPADPTAASPRGCLFHQTVLVWSRPGHRKKTP